MVLFKLGACDLSVSDIYIYIPLWFYSNGLTDEIIERFDIFTFHYGSIQISSTVIVHTTIMEIYIPLWFYSNIKKLEFIVLVKNLHSTMVLFKWFINFKPKHNFILFTFHYGSIQIDILLPIPIP